MPAIHSNSSSKKSQEGSSLYWDRGEEPACANHQQVERGDPSLLLSTGDSSGPRGPVLGSQLHKGHGHTGESRTQIHEGATWTRDLPHPERWRAHSLKNGRLRGDLIEVYKYQIREMKRHKRHELKYKTFHLNVRKSGAFLCYQADQIMEQTAW